MKKYMPLFFLVSVVFAFAACGNKSSGPKIDFTAAEDALKQRTDLVVLPSGAHKYEMSLTQTNLGAYLFFPQNIISNRSMIKAVISRQGYEPNIVIYDDELALGLLFARGTNASTIEQEYITNHIFGNYYKTNRTLTLFPGIYRAQEERIIIQEPRMGVNGRGTFRGPGGRSYKPGQVRIATPELDN